MKEILLTQGKITLVDDEDYDFLMQWKWSLVKGNRTLYAQRKTGFRHQKNKNIWMHRLILNVPDGKQTDHIDHNGLNNQKSNLRICNNSQNQINKRIIKKGKSKYTGVTFVKNKYIVAQISVEHKHINLGYFKTEELAAKAYDEAANRMHGEFATLNFK